jgi:hypothetical protein
MFFNLQRDSWTETLHNDPLVDIQKLLNFVKTDGHDLQRWAALLPRK